MNSITRLAHLFKPNHYDLSLQLDRPGRSFTGTVSIRGSSIDDSDSTVIRLHAKNLSIHSALIDGKAATFQAGDNDELILSHSDLPKSASRKHIVVVEFSGTITDDMVGIYPCYFEQDGVKKELLATQFESHYARQAFPCVDEPEAKATFDVTLITEPNVTALGNMPIKSQAIEDDQLVTRFFTTPKMSSYLVAWVVGELQKKTAVTKRGVEVSVWSTPVHPIESLDFALDIATRSIDFFEDYFGVTYPLPKSDHVALPDFSSGAMENWGLVTYREIALLVDPVASSLPIKQGAALTIAHELSHQWFGNLVTMKWWNDLWLNESFANMMEYVAIDALEPSWNIWLDHATGEVISALRRDSLDGVQPVQVDVHHPDEISTIFDPSIVYAKGGRLLRMLQAYIGEDALRKGLKQYFTQYQYGNTSADDLWKALGEASHQDITHFMNQWITQPGYPVVSVSQDGDELTLKQQRFYIGPHTVSKQLWPIPLHATSKGLPDTLEAAKLRIKQPAQTVRLNQGSTAHFITHYSPDLYNGIVANLPRLSTIDRLGFIHEQTLLVKAGLASSTSLIPLIATCGSETNAAVWESISVAINELMRFVETDERAEVNLKRFVRELVADNYERLGWDTRESDTDNEIKLRSTILSLALYGRHEQALDEATRRFMATPIEKMDAELRATLLVHAVKNVVQPDIIEDLLGKYKASHNSELKDDISLALTATKAETTIHELTLLLKNTTLIRPQDFTHWYVRLIRNRFGREHVWQWSMREWPWIEKTFSNDSHFDMLPRYIAGALATPQQLEEYIQFFEPKKALPALNRNISIGITELAGRVALLEKDGPAVTKVLRDLY